MKKLQTLIFLFYTMHGLNAQNWEWVKSFNNNTGNSYTSYERYNQEYINNIAIDLEGNIYSIDNFTNTLILGSTTLTSAVNGTNIFIEKISSNGDWVWAKQSGGSGTGNATAKCIFVDNSNNTYIGLGHNGNVSFGSYSFNTTDYNPIIAKLSPNGNVLWGINISGWDDGAFINSIVADKDGNVYVSGEFERRVIIAPTRTSKITINSFDLYENPPYERDVFIAKISPTGDPIWAINVGSADGSEETFKMDIDANNYLYIIGTFREDIDGNSQSPSIFGDINIDFIKESKYIAKLNTDGQFSWVYPLTDDNSIGLDLVVDNNENIYCVDNKGFLNKISPDGQLEWSKGIGNDSTNYAIGTAITTDSSNNVYIGGSFYDTVVIGQDILISPISPNGSPQERTFLAKIDELGNWEYAFENNTSNIKSIANSNRIKEIKAVKEDQLIVSGDGYLEDELIFRGKVTHQSHVGDNNDLNISVYPINEARGGFNSSYRIVFNNVGTTQLDGDIMFKFDNSKLTFLNSSQVVDSQNSNSLSFIYNGLAPKESRFIDLNFVVNFISPETEETLSFETSINPIIDDLTQEDNVFTFNQPIVNSFDPNDILVIEGDKILLENSDEYLHYIIRFQNIGTASAINVKVNNLFDSNLDWTTFQLESSSHSLNIERVYGYDISFIFNGINLPDSTSDEPNSHGFIAYKIKPKKNITVGEFVPNEADIYFDFNPAVPTNLVNTEVVSTLGVSETNSSPIYLYPNPTSNILNVKSNSPISKIYVYNSLGQKVISFFNQSKVDISILNKGLYFVEIYNDSGRKLVSRFIKK